MLPGKCGQSIPATKKCTKLKLPSLRAMLSPPRPPALRGGFNAVSLTRSGRAGNGAVCRK